MAAGASRDAFRGFPLSVSPRAFMAYIVLVRFESVITRVGANESGDLADTAVGGCRLLLDGPKEQRGGIPREGLGHLTRWARIKANRRDPGRVRRDSPTVKTTERNRPQQL